MSNKKKPKKLRTPNVPSSQVAVAVAAGAPAQTRGGGRELAGSARQMRAAPAAAAPVNFDYTYVKKDLGRIAILAGSFIAILVVLSFFIK